MQTGAECFNATDTNTSNKIDENNKTQRRKTLIPYIIKTTAWITNASDFYSSLSLHGFYCETYSLAHKPSLVCFMIRDKKHIFHGEFWGYKPYANMAAAN